MHIELAHGIKCITIVLSKLNAALILMGLKLHATETLSLLRQFI